MSADMYGQIVDMYVCLSIYNVFVHVYYIHIYTQVRMYAYTAGLSPNGNNQTWKRGQSQTWWFARGCSCNTNPERLLSMSKVDDIFPLKGSYLDVRPS